MRSKKKKHSKLLVEVKAGIEHLYEKLAFYRLEESEKLEVNRETLIDVVNNIYEKMARIYATGFFSFKYILIITFNKSIQPKNFLNYINLINMFIN